MNLKGVSGAGQQNLIISKLPTRWRVMHVMSVTLLDISRPVVQGSESAANWQQKKSSLDTPTYALYLKVFFLLISGGDFQLCKRFSSIYQAPLSHRMKKSSKKRYTVHSERFQIHVGFRG